MRTVNKSHSVNLFGFALISTVFGPKFGFVVLDSHNVAAEAGVPQQLNTSFMF